MKAMLAGYGGKGHKTLRMSATSQPKLNRGGVRRDGKHLETITIQGETSKTDQWAENNDCALHLYDLTYEECIAFAEALLGMASRVKSQADKAAPQQTPDLWSFQTLAAVGELLNDRAILAQKHQQFEQSAAELVDLREAVVAGMSGVDLRARMLQEFDQLALSKDLRGFLAEHGVSTPHAIYSILSEFIMDAAGRQGVLDELREELRRMGLPPGLFYHDEYDATDWARQNPVGAADPSPDHSSAPSNVSEVGNVVPFPPIELNELD